MTLNLSSSSSMSIFVQSVIPQFRPSYGFLLHPSIFYFFPNHFLNLSGCCLLFQKILIPSLMSLKMFQLWAFCKFNHLLVPVQVTKRLQLERETCTPLFNRFLSVEGEVLLTASWVPVLCLLCSRYTTHSFQAYENFMQDSVKEPTRVKILTSASPYWPVRSVCLF